VRLVLGELAAGWRRVHLVFQVGRWVSVLGQGSLSVDCRERERRLPGSKVALSFKSLRDGLQAGSVDGLAYAGGG
jgi:hypothetical protein